MYPETIEKLSQAMDFRTDSLVLIIEDEKVSMRGLLRNYPDFAKKFETVISIPVFTNDELVRLPARMRVRMDTRWTRWVCLLCIHRLATIRRRASR